MRRSDIGQVSDLFIKKKSLAFCQKTVQSEIEQSESLLILNKCIVKIISLSFNDSDNGEKNNEKSKNDSRESKELVESY